MLTQSMLASACNPSRIGRNLPHRYIKAGRGGGKHSREQAPNQLTKRAEFWRSAPAGNADGSGGSNHRDSKSSAAGMS